MSQLITSQEMARGLAKDFADFRAKHGDEAALMALEALSNCLFEGLSTIEGAVAVKPAPIHASDCALHNAPLMEPGPCDCGAE